MKSPYCFPNPILSSSQSNFSEVGLTGSSGDPYLLFRSNTTSEEIGKFSFSASSVSFTGNADASAQTFINIVQSKYASVLQSARDQERESIVQSLEKLSPNAPLSSAIHFLKMAK